MKRTDAIKQVVTFALVVLVLIVIIPLVKRSFTSVPGLQARVGETFTVSLDSNADPAFRWDPLATDTTRVQLVHQPDAKEALTKTKIWTFRAIAPGEVTLYFGYLRVGSPNSIAARTRSVALTVNP